jgi:hypothetical protein
VVLNSVNRLFEEEAAQGMVEYLLLLNLVVFKITGMFLALTRLFTGS